MMQENTRNVWLTCVLIAAATVRIAYLVNAWDSPALKIPIIDSEYYHQWAVSLANGEAGEKDVFFMSPLYPYALSVIYKLLGAYPQAVAILQALGGIALVWMIYLLGKRLFNPDVGLLAAVFAALYRPFIYYEGVLLSTTLILLLNAGALLLLLSNSRKRWIDVVVGGLLGLSALARPNVLIFVGLLALIWLFRPSLGGWKRTAMLLLGVVLTLSPAAIRNHHISGEWVLTTAGFGMNFYAGNNPSAQGIYWEAPFIRSAEPKYENLDYRKEATRVSGKEQSISGTSRFWGRQGLLFITHEPMKYFELLLRKLFLFFHETEIPNNYSIYAAESYSRFLRRIPFTFGLLAPLGIAFWLYAARRPEMTLVHVYGLAYLSATLLFFAASEYRLPLMLILLPMTAAGLQAIRAWMQSKLKSKAVTLAVLGIVIALPVNMPTQFTGKLQSPYMDYFNMGSVLQKQGRFDESVAMLQRALVLQPNFPEGHRLLGDSYHVLGMREPAVEEFRRAGMDPQRELNIRDAEGLFDQAQALAKQGQSRPAMDLYMQGLAIHHEPPGYVYFNIAYLALTIGDTLQSEHYLHEAGAADPLEPRVPFLSGLIDESRSNWPQAGDKFLQALALQSTFHLARAHAALAMLRQGNIAQAERLLEPLVQGQIRDPALKEVVDLVMEEVGY
jgi:tetratricopeptide (TPR) repeat protein